MITYTEIHRKPIAPSMASAVAALISGLWLSSVSAQAAVLTNVPMQGGMLMPEVTYHADTDRATVDLSGIGLVAQLTPLLISHPRDSFDPADPWFEFVDPSRQGLAFSRRYGFDMNPNTDMLPENRELWIRKTAGSTNLAIYDYNASTSPKRWTPIFGTAGSSNAASWSGLMWHVGVTAPAGTNSYSTTFEVYVVNTATGREVPGSGSGPFVLQWTCVPDGRPELNITVQPAEGLLLTWPASATNWTLVCSSNLVSGPWVPADPQAVVFSGPSNVCFTCAAVQQFYRMERKP
jgi:hypothetical protein